MRANSHIALLPCFFASSPSSPPPHFIISGMRPFLFHLPIMVSTHRRADFPPITACHPFTPQPPPPPGPFITLAVAQSASVSLPLSLVTLSVFFPSLCAGLIFYELLDDGCSLLGKQPQLSPPSLPACLLISKPSGEPFSLNSLPFTDSLSLSIAFFSGSN